MKNILLTKVALLDIYFPFKLAGQGETSPHISLQRVCVHAVQR